MQKISSSFHSSLNMDSLKFFGQYFLITQLLCTGSMACLGQNLDNFWNGILAAICNGLQCGCLGGNWEMYVFDRKMTHNRVLSDHVLIMDSL